MNYPPKGKERQQGNREKDTKPVAETTQGARLARGNMTNPLRPSLRHLAVERHLEMCQVVEPGGSQTGAL